MIGGNWFTQNKLIHWALWLTGLTSWLSCVLCFVTFPNIGLVHIRIKGEVGAVKLVKALQLNIFADCSKAVLLLWIICGICLVFVMLLRLFIAAFGHLMGTGWPLGSCLWCLLCFVTFPCGMLGQVWYLIVSFPDLCRLSYFELKYIKYLQNLGSGFYGNRTFTKKIRNEIVVSF